MHGKQVKRGTWKNIGQLLEIEYTKKFYENLLKFIRFAISQLSHTHTQIRTLVRLDCKNDFLVLQNILETDGKWQKDRWENKY